MDTRQPTRNDNIVAFGFIGVMLIIVAVLCIIALTSGCAYYKVNPQTGEGVSYGFLRSLEVVRVYDAEGHLVSETIAAKSNTSDVLLGINELGKTAVDTWDKVKP